MTSGADYDSNIAVLDSMAADAEAAGCHVLALPEAAGLMQRDFASATGIVRPREQDAWSSACARLARQHALWVHSGSSPVLGSNGKFRNEGGVFDPQGQELARYGKIHLFDVDLPGAAPIRESDRYEPGSRGTVLDTPLGRWGLTICYDLRFPALFRDYAKLGAEVIFVPSAFAIETGRAHWETLLRARAIENGVWIVAAAQTGSHADGRHTWGHSLVVDPWGDIVLDMGRDETGIAVVEIDLAKVRTARAQVPALHNERPYEIDLIPEKNLAVT
ncbi:carbon-nitrogen hydrolase family protein [Rhodobacteraceae bacterium CCMM004]|nr:carbon-nitrogen hydrolase family protein [Rhodobacteraceae bacterium CCMM004]